MLDRRELLGLSTVGVAAAVGMGSMLKSKSVLAAEAAQLAADGGLRGADGRHVRLGELDVESRQDYTKGYRVLNRRSYRQVSEDMFERLIQREGVDPTSKISIDELRALVDLDPNIGLMHKSWLANQRVTWKNLQDHYHQNADFYLSQMEAADKSGPGSLELLASQSALPDHVKHEIHIQPGGYVGDPFAGHLYHYGTNSFWFGTRGHNEQDEIHREVAHRMPLPKDGKVRRILDYGTGVGQFAMALKARFPDAEVWGLDAGGPMVRYSHMRANNLGIPVNFIQSVAEQTQFPDGYFDMVTSFIAHHEMPAQVTRQVVAEVERITRPGGVYYPLDFISGGTTSTPRGMFGRWYDHRWNNEVWSMEYHSIDFTAEIAKRDFRQVKDAQAAMRGFGIRHFERV
ncbi:class I SAM-dependent methyltransferase [Parahaliea maris]|uniref:Class I SAM-dependent methyltransferase n=1 Tax=Parahaliea maris TaxID=2716870 RepID=A0A5C8ZWJ5_9GAMM|nr:class I SAM-dependent methyltransferase [Parahaliea maris]TXS91972.1 class I SAM-dependent methyltransferase [Parahaliea maris]